MNLVNESSKQNVQQTEAPRLFTVREFAEKNQAQGTWPSTQSAIWALRAGSPQNGFGSAFLNVGRRVLIYEDRFWEAIAELQEGGSNETAR